MTPEMREFIDLLESQLGYSEKAGAYTKYGDWYGRNVESDADYSSAPWCDMFLAWAATKLGYEDWMGQFAWTVAHARWFKKQDAWGTKPEPGAFVFFDWGGSNSIGRIDHVGVVTKVVGNRIHTIEGNIDGGVAKRKVRDTDKVVGYGYPWKIKERLDAEAAVEAKVGIGTVQEEPGLATLFPHVERTEKPKAPLSSRPGEHALKQAEEPAPEPTASKKPEPAPTAEAAPAPAPSAAKSATPKTGKHAKPATADTEAVTTGPIPVITDAAPAAQTSTVDSPTLLTSALVAALAVLAVAKARTLRMRPALAGAGAAGPQRTPRSHRRRKKSAPEPVRTMSARPLQEPMELEAHLPQPVKGMEPVTALKALRTPFTDRPIVIPEATSPFDAFSRPARPASAPEPLIKLVWDDEKATRCLITDTGPIEIPREPGLYELPDPYSGFHLVGGASGPFPIREEPVMPLVPAGAGVAGGLHAETRTGARAEARSGGLLEGRADLGGNSGAGFAQDVPLRGRRHRQTPDVSRFEPFFPDAPLRGRRHRPPHDSAHRPSHEPIHRVSSYEPHRSPHDTTHLASHDGPRRISYDPYEPAGRAHQAELTLTHEPARARPAERVAVDSRGASGPRRKPRRGRHRA